MDIELWQQRLQPVLLPWSAIYSAGMGLRRIAYKKGLFKSWRPPAPCISVGNIAWGGSGKTPLCAWILQWSLRQGLRPALLTRGYKGRPSDLPFLVSMDTLPVESGDEALLLAREIPEAQIVVDPLRSRGGRWIARQGQPDLYVLDDGLQHMAVQRDLDLILLRPEDLHKQWNRVMPAGPWREGSGAFGSASAFLIKAGNSELQDLQPKIYHRLGIWNKPLFSFTLRIRKLVRLIDGSRIDNTDWQQDYILVSAVGNPPQVEKSIANYLNKPALQHYTFRDHANYSERIWKRIEDKACRLNAAIICTPKDAVKLELFASSRLWSVEPELVFGQSLFSAVDFESWLQSKLVERQDQNND